MTPLFKKLNFKDQKLAVILHAPVSFEPEAEAMQPYVNLHRQFDKTAKADFMLAFVRTQAEVDAIAIILPEHTAGDAVVWIAYPKASSKRYTCDFNRDTGWEVLGKLGFEPVRQVAIDEDWSALRFRRVEYIRTMTRSAAITEGGKAKTNPAPTASAPADLLEALREAPQVLAFFEQLAPSHRKEYIRWIEEAKKPATRRNRISKAIAMLVEGRKLS